MVRGRRVRAVVPCGKNNDCCSPLPKRRDHGVISGKYISSTNNTQTITQFFQAVVGDIDDANQGIEEFCIQSHNVLCEEKIDAIIEDGNDLDDKEKEEFKEIITTPNMKVNKLKSVIDDLLSPPTPHRIELCLGEEEDKNQEDGKVPNPIIPMPRKAPAVPTKARRKLNNNQASNQTLGKLDKVTNNHKLSDFFPVRRSVRKTNKVVLEEKQRTLEDTLRKGLEIGLKVQTFDGKGRGVVASQVFNRGDFVVEYAGDLIDLTEAKRREAKYGQDQNTGCYMYYFKHKGQQHCVDATAETGRLGRLVNHSRNGNLLTRTIDVDNKPRLVLIAKDTIEIGEEVTYDYGDRSKESLRYHPWLAY